MLNINEYLINKKTKRAFTFNEFIDEINENWKGCLYIIDKREHKERDGSIEYITLVISNHEKIEMGVPYIELEYVPKKYGEVLEQTTVPHTMSDPKFFFVTVYYNKHIKVKNIDYNILSFEDEDNFYRRVYFPMSIKTLDYIYNILNKNDND